MPKTTKANNVTPTNVMPVVEENNIATPVEAVSEKEAVSTPAVKRPAPVLAADTLVPCISMVRRGDLIYNSKRTFGYNVVWRHYMDIQSVELSELVAMRSSDHKFFSENLIVISNDFELHDEVLKYLHIEQYYHDVPDPYAMDDLFSMAIDEMVLRVSRMPENTKEAVCASAKNAIHNGTLDSLKRINALEGALNCKLT